MIGLGGEAWTERGSMPPTAIGSEHKKRGAEAPRIVFQHSSLIAPCAV